MPNYKVTLQVTPVYVMKSPASDDVRVMQAPSERRAEMLAIAEYILDKPDTLGLPEVKNVELIDGQDPGDDA